MAVILATTVSTSYAQKLSASKVPAEVKIAFAKNHAATKVGWVKETANYEAEFMLNGKETSELYSIKGALLETETEIKITELPDLVKMKLKGQKIAEAAKITKADGTIVYEAEINGKDMLFDPKGNPVKK